MTAINELIEKVEAFDVERALSLAASSRAFLMAVTESQRMQFKLGMNSKGERIGRYRSAMYARRKNEQNPLAGLGNVDLILIGDFQKGVFAQSEGDELEIGSTDEKTPMLESNYDDIFGLNDESIPDVVPELSDEFIKEFSNETNL